LRAYVINLVRRPDRMAVMAAQLRALAIPYQRIDAVDAQTVTDDEIARYLPRHAELTFPLTRGAKSCFSSHRKAWETFLASGEDWGVVLEDDARLHPDASHFLSNDSWIPARAALLKIEVNFLRSSNKILLGNGKSIGRGYWASPMLSKHMGSGGYILSRAGAATLIELAGSNVRNIDQMLFNPNVSPVFSKLKPLQVHPALMAQSTETGLSDLSVWRVKARSERLNQPRGIRKLLGRLSRSLEEFRSLPRGAALLLLGKARMVEIEFRSADGSAANAASSWVVHSPFQ
jgi:glycosyl transferase family 25